MQEIKYKVEYVDINKLYPHPENPRFIKDDSFSLLCESIQNNPEYFETRPIICDKDFVIWAGNMRYRGAKHLGWKAVPTVILDLSEEKLREIMIRDNVSSGEFDIGLLSALYSDNDLEKYGVDLSMFGVSTKDEDDSNEKKEGSDKTSKVCPHCGKEI